LENIASESSETLILYGSCNPKAQSLLQQVDVPQDMIVFIGPEGGLTPDEEHLLREYGGREVRLTDTVLRIETAAVAAAAILCAKRDNFS
jgi:RsmE family RNA methyltransferase